MKLSDLAKLPKNQIRVIDRTKESHYPLRWDNVVHILHKDKMKSVRRYNAFLSGLCDGSKDPFPAVPKCGGAYQNCGRPRLTDNEKKIAVKIGIEKSVVDSLGGLKSVQKLLIAHVKTLI